MTEKSIILKKADASAIKLENDRGLESSWIFFLLTVMFCSNLFGRGSLLCLAFAVFALLKLRNTLVIDGMGVVVLLFSAAALIPSFAYEGVVEAVKCLNFVFMYLIGLNGFYAARDKKKYLERLFLALFFGYILYVVLLVLWNINVETREGQRILYNIWSGDPISVTLVGLLCSVPIGFSFYAIFLNKKKWIKITAILGVIVVFIINARTATRTPIILMLIVTLIMAAIYLYDQNAKRAVRIIALMLFIFAVVGIAYGTNLFGLRSAIESTPIYQRFMEEGTDTRRSELIIWHMQYMMEYPFGGSNIARTVGTNAHNVLQQAYDLYGVGAFVLVTVICGSIVATLVKFLRMKNREPIDYLFIAMYISMLIQSFLEPILTGYPCFLFSFLMIHGTATAYLRKYKVMGGDR